MNLLVEYSDNGMRGEPIGTKPKLVRSGLMARDVGEITPFLYNGKLMLMASAHRDAEANLPRYGNMAQAHGTDKIAW